MFHLGNRRFPDTGGGERIREMGQDATELSDFNQRTKKYAGS